MKPRKGQIAVIITFVIAVIFLFVAVFINLSKVSQVKTTTSQATDKAALGLASQLGSMSHYYAEKALEGKGKEIPEEGVIEYCNKSSLSDFLPLAVLIGIGILTGIASFFFAPALPIIIGAAAAAVSTVMLSGITTEFEKMTGKNAMRESALFQALLSTQSDDVELKRTGVKGIFHDETTGQDYDLSPIPEMHNERKVSRFLAWYYTKRLLFAGDDYLKQAVDVFKSKLKRFIDIEWDSAKWKVSKLSYFIEPGPASKGADYEITCTSNSSCPPWVKNIALKQIAIIKIDATLKGEKQITGGFPREKFLDLAKRLKNSYGSGLSFCAKDISGSVYCDDINFLMLSLWDFLSKIKEVSDIPASYAYKNVTQWLPSFYDSAKHNPDGSAKNCDSLDCDVYLRLTRVQNNINSWITELEALNNRNTDKTGIIDIIEKAHGDCTWGRGKQLDRTCNTVYGPNCAICGGNYCGESSEDPCDCPSSCCYAPQKCAWEGNYYTCDKDPPVCRPGYGDLYGNIPGWCSSHGYHASCSPSCASCTENFDWSGEARNFQGQLAYDNTTGPTEVEQAIRIMKALSYDITQIKGVISELADKVDFYFKNKGEPFTDANNNGVYDENEKFTDLNGNGVYDSVFGEVIKRDEIVYAWKDKKGFSHLAFVKIKGYPKELPKVTESIEWAGLKKCRRLYNYQGDFTITTSRYDQDQPTDIGGWKLRRRKKGATETGREFGPEYLQKIVVDVQDNGKIDTTQAYIGTILSDYAITSCSKVHYSPKKSDIYIKETKCD